MSHIKRYKHYLFDWGDTLMVDSPDEKGPMYKWSKVEPVEGAFELLFRLSKIAKCHVATNAKDSSAILIGGAFVRVGMIDFISRIFCFQSIRFEKPSEQFFESIMSSLKCEKSEVVMIGDNIKNDVIGALNFGIDAIWFNKKRDPVPGNIVSIDKLLQIID